MLNFWYRHPDHWSESSSNHRIGGFFSDSVRPMTFMYIISWQKGDAKFAYQKVDVKEKEFCVRENESTNRV